MKTALACIFLVFSMLCLACVAYAEQSVSPLANVDFLTAFLQVVPAWLQAASLVVTAASSIAALTPSPRDDGALRVIRKVIDILAFNFGAAKNVSEGVK